MVIDTYFHSGEIEAQERWHTTTIWNAERKTKLLWDEIPDSLFHRLEAAPFFFLATSNSQGECDCSFKGGGPNLIRIISGTKFAFPDFDGNGAFMSIGNILQNPNVGCLFIDFSSRERLRVNGTASVHDTGEIKTLFPDSPRVILVDVKQVVPNCAAHVPQLIEARSL